MRTTSQDTSTTPPSAEADNPSEGFDTRARQRTRCSPVHVVGSIRSVGQSHNRVRLDDPEDLLGAALCSLLEPCAATLDSVLPLGFEREVLEARRSLLANCWRLTWSYDAQGFIVFAREFAPQRLVGRTLTLHYTPPEAS